MKIGLFPLNIVLFPNSIYPLHIFEDRYKELINTVNSNNSYFGINLMTSSNIREIGCTAQVQNISKIYDDGKMDISVRGIQRYKLNNIIDGEESYLIGEIEFIEDKVEKADHEILESCVNIFNNIVDTVSVLRVQKLDLEDLPDENLSYLFAQKSGLIPEQKQTLLEMDSENERLLYMKEHLEKIKPKVSKAYEIEKIIRNDGYLKPEQWK